MEYLFTERAHLMCPGMCFGIAAAVRAVFDEPRFRAALETLAAAHPFLNARLAQEGDAYYYDVTDRPQTEVIVLPDALASLDAPAVMVEYRRLTGYDWDLRREGMLKAAAWPMGEKTCVLLVFHHLLADGRGALGLVRELADLYAAGIEPNKAPEKLIASVDDFPPDSRMPFISRMLVRKANRDWGREGHRVSYEAYHAAADAYVRQTPVEHSLTRSDAAALAEIEEACHAQGVTVNDYLLAKLFTDERTDRIVIACDLRDRLACYVPGALGNYATAFSVEVRKKDADLYRLAQTVHAKVRRKMARASDLYLVLQCYAALDPTLLDAAWMACAGGFESRAGRFIGGMFFGFAAAAGCSVTNLGRMESDTVDAAYFIPPASPAMRLTQGVLTVNGEMRVCTSERQSGEKG